MYECAGLGSRRRSGTHAESRQSNRNAWETREAGEDHSRNSTNDLSADIDAASDIANGGQSISYAL
jgi:hypothetical protein